MCKLMEEYKKRTLNRFMKKLTVPGEKCNLKMRMNLRIMNNHWVIRKL